MCTDIYILPVADHYLLYSPLRQVTALVNATAVTSLKYSLQGSTAPEDLPGMLHDLSQEFSQPVQTPSLDDTGVRPMFLGLLPTRACNQACVYCDFGASTAPMTKMDFRMAAMAVDWIASHTRLSGDDSFEVHFFGGEPFFAGDVVDVAVHRARNVASQSGLLPRFEVATNGIFDEARARFVGDYFDTVVLSFDGPQDIQDRQRPGRHNSSNFHVVTRTAHLLSQSPTELCFRVCVSHETVARLEEIVQWFCETFRPSVMNIEVLQANAVAAMAGLKPPDPYDFAIHYLQARRLAQHNYGIKTIYASALLDTIRYSFCPVGKDALIVSPDGRVSGCYLPQKQWQQRGLGLDVGWLTSNGTMQLDNDAITRLRRMVMEKPRCERCFCRWTCAGGCHVNHSYPGCSLDYDDFCIQTRLISAYSLLAESEFSEIGDTLLESRSAMQTLALQPSDCLNDWKI